MMTGTGRGARSQTRRTAILASAVAMLGDHGFNGLTVQALAQRCGISNAGLLYYFGSKDEILLAVLGEFELRERDVLMPFVQAAGQADGPAGKLDAIEHLFRGMVRRVAERPDLARFLFVLQAEALDRSHVAHGWFHQRERLSMDFLASLLTGLTPDPASMARRLMALLRGMSQLWLSHDMAFDLEREWQGAFGLTGLGKEKQ